MIIYKKHVQEFTLGLGYVWQTPIIMTEKEVKAEIENQGGQVYQNVRYEEIDIDKQAATIARLTAAHEMQGEELVTLPRHMVYSMEDKLKAQAAEIVELKGIAANLARHLEAIQNITERGDHTDIGFTFRAIRRHCEAANVMEAV